jgi:tetratricopeptide (TPR) repeat protein/transcriptional regulator with XRE-family HTH domain
MTPHHDDAGPTGTDGDLALSGWLRRLRRQRGMSQRHLLPHLHIASHSTIADYESGRRIPPADVLAAYERFFEVPSGRLLALRDRELAHRAATESRPEVAGPDAAGLTALPRQLPVPDANFTGRTQEMAALDAVLTRDTHVEPVVISAISGMGGVGKTALAVRWAHRVRDEFPDGELYVDLRGYHSTGTPLPAADVLSRFLRALGVRSEHILPTVDERAAQYRTAVAGRRMLVVLDNARNVEQVRPLLPGATQCVVLVTSRSRLAGLVAREGAHRIDLDVLSPGEANQLLRNAIGAARVDAEPEASATLAVRCGFHPLALRVAAERIAARRDTGVAAALAELADRHRRLDVLTPIDDGDSAVRTAFSWSYDALPAPARRLFRQLGLVGGPDISTAAAAALAGLPAAEQLLAVLASAHLVDEHAPGRFRLHDLLQLYAHEVALREDSDNERRAAVRRLCGWYLHTAAAARVALSPGLPPMRPEPIELDSPALVFTGHADALAWCEAELANLVAAVSVAEEYGLHRIAWQMPTALYGFFDLRKYYQEWIGTHEVALRSARAAGDLEAEGRILCNIGNAYLPMRRYSPAEAHYLQALAIFGEVGYLQGEAKVWGNLGMTYDRTQRHEESAAAHHRAIDIFRQLGDRFGEALTMTNLGELRFRQESYEDAAGHHRLALAIFQEIGDHHGEAEALSDLGNALARLGDFATAIDCQLRALELFRQTGDRYEEAMALAELGDVHMGLGRSGRATAYHRQALVLYREIGDDEAATELLAKLHQRRPGSR